MGREDRRKRKNRKRSKLISNIVLIMIFVVIIYVAPKFISSAKYVYNKVNEHYLSSKDFYFKSDKLSKEGVEYKVTNNWSGAEPYTITINMSSKKNDKAFTESDIDYGITCTCSSNVTYTLSKTTSTIVGSKNHGVNQDSFTVSISPANGNALNEGAEAWVLVKAKSTSPYSLELTGKLIIGVGTSDIFYEIIDFANQPYFTVNITNSQNVGANVTLMYNPTYVLLDMTDRYYINSVTSATQQINNYAYLNSITAYVGSLSTTSVKFYKIDATQNYSYLSGSNQTPMVRLTY